MLKRVPLGVEASDLLGEKNLMYHLKHYEVGHWHVHDIGNKLASDYDCYP